MTNEQTFLLGLLKITDAVIESFRKDPSKLRKEELPIVPDKYNTIPATKLSPGMTVYHLRDKPKFEGLVKEFAEDSESGEIIVEFVDGHTRVLKATDWVHTCCLPK